MLQNVNLGRKHKFIILALRDNESVFKRVTEARRATRADKKKHAMQMRDLVLKKFNMSTNQVGQVQTKSKALTEIGELVDETGPGKMPKNHSISRNKPFFYSLCHLPRRI